MKLTEEEWFQKATWQLLPYRLWGLVPYVRVKRGSVVLKHVYGFTTRHAYHRVANWLDSEGKRLNRDR